MFKLNISSRIGIGYLVILSIAIIVSGVSILRLQNNTKKYNEISNVYLPSISDLKELEALNKEANNIITNWINNPNKDEKERLKVIQTEEYPDLKFRIKHSSEFESEAALDKAHTELLNAFDTIIAFQKKIMRNLTTTEQYNNDTLVDASINILENEIKPHYNSNQLYLKNVLKYESDYLKQLETDLHDSLNYLTLTMFIMLILILVIGVYASFRATRSITRPIKSLKNIIVSLSKGEIPQVDSTHRHDEIGEMTNAIAAMTENIKLRAEFATKTGMGDYSPDFNLLSEKDILGLALMKMRNNLQENAKKNSDKNWVRTGVLKAGELLRMDEGGALQMYTRIISFLAEYTEAFRGAIFILNDHDKDNIHLNLAAGYAINKSFAEIRNIRLGESLAGQAVLDKKTIVIDDIPQGSIKITTGLVEASPKSIIIVPLVFDEKIKGVIELAGTREFTDMHREFLEKISRNIAIAIDIVEREERMKSLLSESHQLNERLKNNEVKLKTANDELSTFVYRASHDLRGPLMSILGLVNVYQRDQVQLGGNGTNYMGMVGESANRLDRILTVLIKAMSIKEEVLKIDRIYFPAMLEELVSSLNNHPKTQGAKFTVDIDVERPFHTDYEIVRYALYNIIENAVKFQNKSLPESYVLVGIYDFDGGVKINISDNGIGIKKGIQGKLFEMFFRGNAKTEGSGLGLYMVKKIITKLNGRIEFNSEEGTGTFVSIYLPDLSSGKKEVTEPKEKAFSFRN